MPLHLKRNLPEIPWHYSVKRSGRAKRIRLSYSASKGLELVLPTATPIHEGVLFLASQGKWIAELSQRHGVDLQQPPSVPLIPRSITLKSIGETFPVQRGPRMGLKESGGELLLKASPEQAPLLMQRWMKQKALCVLLPWLTECSERTGLVYTRASVRNQSSRWGSYSSRGTVSLNCRLLLLEPAEVEYVLLHELCHSKFMDHSPRFWSLLQSVCPDALELDRAVDRAAQNIPAWLTFKGYILLFGGLIRSA